jgi:hypothetical protein
MPSVGPSDLVQVLGREMPCIPSEMHMIGPSQLVKACEVRGSGFVFFAGTLDGTYVTLVFTHDAAFVTPEGIRVGSTLADVRNTGGSDVLAFRGWGYASTLPSGWNVVFSQIPSALEEQIDPEAVVSEIWRQAGAAEPLSGPRVSTARSLPKAQARTCEGAEGSLNWL